MPTVDDYLGLVPPMNADKPDFIATLKAALNPLVDIQTAISGLSGDFDLDDAIGAQLDIVGIWIGRTRFVETPITGVYFSWDTELLGWEQGYWQGAFDPDEGVTRLDDGTYRKLLYAKAAANVWRGTIGEVIDMFKLLLVDEGVSATVTDNMDMTMQVEVHGAVQNAIFRAILVGNYLPIKPAGVAINYLIKDPVSFPVSATITGFGGVFARAGLVRFASATIRGTGAMIAGGASFQQMQISGTGSVIGRANLLRPIGITINATGGVTAFGSRAQPISATMAGVGTIIANASRAQPAAATIAGTGAVIANSLVSAAGYTVTMGAEAFIIANANVVSRFGNSATINGVGSVTATAVVSAGQTRATIAGIGSVIGSATILEVAQATIPGTGLVSVPGMAPVQMVGSIIIPGAGGITADSSRGTSLLSASATIAGLGGVVGSAGRRQTIAATISGAGGTSFNIPSNQQFVALEPARVAVQNSGSFVNTRAYGVQSAQWNTGSVIGKYFKPSGKWYWEFNFVRDGYDPVNGGTYIVVGIVGAYWNNTGGFTPYTSQYPTYSNYGLNCWRNWPLDGTGGYKFGSFSENDTGLDSFVYGNRICFAMDLTNWKLWIRVNNGSWNRYMTGTQDPASNQGGIPFDPSLQNPVIGGYGPWVNLNNPTDTVDGCFDPSTWLYANPSGFGSM